MKLYRLSFGFVFGILLSACSSTGLFDYEKQIVLNDSRPDARIPQDKSDAIPVDGQLPLLKPLHKPFCTKDNWCWESPKPQGNTIRKVWGSAWNDVWAVGDYGLIMRHNGREWTDFDIGTREDMVGLSGRSADDIWTVGSNGSILHWNGTEWNLQKHALPDRIAFYKASIVNSKEIWALANGHMTSRVTGRDVFRWDGIEWKKQHLFPKVSYNNNIVAFSDTNVWVTISTRRLSRKRPMVL